MMSIPSVSSPTSIQAAAPATPRCKRWRLDVLAAALLFVLGGLYVWQASATLHGGSGNPLGELLISFGPAALFASDQGMALPLDGVSPALDAFLRGQRFSVDGADIAARGTPPHILGDYVDTFTLTHWLLFYSVGWCWRIFGVSIGSLHLLMGLLGGLTALALYALFRLGMRRSLAVAGVAGVLLLPPFLVGMESLRDFSKALFLISFLVLAGLLLSRRHTGRGLLTGALGLALVLGIGFGFRQDLLVCAPMALCLLLLAPLSGGRIWVRLLAAVVFLCVFWALSTPVFRGMRHESGSVTTHTLFQGLSQEAEQVMQFGDASYELLLTPSDTEVHATINRHARMRGVDAPMQHYLSPAYAESGRRLFLEWARTFPADLFARGLASMASIMRLTGGTLESFHYLGLPARLRDWPCFCWHGVYARWVEPSGLILLFLVLLMFSVRNMRFMLSMLLLLAYFMAYPNLLFQIRHSFYLCFLVPWAMLFLLDKGMCFCAALWRGGQNAVPVRGYFHAMCCGGLALSLVILASAAVLWGLRAYQTRQASALLGAYRAAALHPLEVRHEEGADGVLIAPTAPLPGLEDAWNLALGESAAACVVLSLDPAPFAYPIELCHAPGQGPYFDRRLTIAPRPSDDGAMLVFIPIYALANFSPYPFTSVKYRFNNTPLANLLVHRLGVNAFEGLRLRSDTLPYVRGIYYVDNPEALPWLLYATLPEKESHLHFCKQFGWEKSVQAWPVEWELLVSGNVDRALEQYLDLLARYPHHASFMRRIESLVPEAESPGLRADALFQLGGYVAHGAGRYAVALAEAGADQAAAQRFDAAVYCYEKALLLAPGESIYCLHLGELFLKQKQYDRALPLLRRALEGQPESVYAADLADQIFAETTDASGQRAFWEAILRMHPQAALPRERYERALSPSAS